MLKVIFLKKIKNIGKIPEGAVLVTADVVGLYPSIPHGSLRKRLNERETPRLPTKELIKMAEFVLKNNFFEFNEEVKKQKSETAIGTKFAPPYACIFAAAVETEFLTSQYLVSFFWLRYIDGTFFIWTHFHPNLRFTYETSKSNVKFFRFKCKLKRWCNTY